MVNHLARGQSPCPWSITLLMVDLTMIELAYVVCMYVSFTDCLQCYVCFLQLFQVS